VLSLVNKTCSLCLRQVARALFSNQVVFLHQQLKIALEKNHECFRSAVPRSLVEILVVGEDQRFWNHAGIDLAAICRAIYHTVVYQQLQGASTIEQQLVRTLTGYRKFSLTRKLREVLLASVIGDFISKRDIASLYLCCAYYGWRMNSLAEACRRMNFSIETMTRAESATLVARLKYPEPQLASPERRALMTSRALYLLRRAAS